ncbi:MAG: D-glycero-beta-D-manno-heptose 1-phosphate adenylyltransferase [Candidatus Eisenbacteria bacterium]|nr:D-glycero-beta-D-manno-heptose 1-phosphate adenylyltransferase [Candidatus Eisenbacteria bacterium]
MSETFVLPAEAASKLAIWRASDARIVFTNGVYDLMHRGHAEYLEEARALGDRLVVGINTDASVRRLKGPSRPVVALEDRAGLLRALSCVDLVIAFDDDTPLRLIEAVQPDVLVKGADYAIADIVGREVVESRGGTVTTITLREGLSTSTIIDRIKTGRGV